MDVAVGDPRPIAPKRCPDCGVRGEWPSQPCPVCRQAARLERLVARVLGERDALYTPSSLAERLAVSKRTAVDLLARGDIPSFLIGPQQRRIDPAEVEAFLERKRRDG